ncbi:unnamed protein product [Caenorhabditis nigoni]
MGYVRGLFLVKTRMVAACESGLGYMINQKIRSSTIKKDSITPKDEFTRILHRIYWKRVHCFKRGLCLALACELMLSHVFSGSGFVIRTWLYKGHTVLIGNSMLLIHVWKQRLRFSLRCDSEQKMDWKKLLKLQILVFFQLFTCY